MTPDPDLDVRIDDFSFKFAIRSRNVLAAHNDQLDFQGRESFRVESGRRTRTVPDRFVTHELGLEDEAAAPVVGEPGHVDEVLLVLRLIVESN